MVTIEINGISKSAKPSGGVAVFEIEGLAAGVKTVVATYAGDDVYAFNSTTANFTVSKVKSSVNVTVSGRTVKVSVPEDATGYVIVNVNGTEYAINITAGDSEITIRLTKSGIYYVVATYLGDDKYLSSENSTSFAGKATDDTTNIEILDGTADTVIVKVTVPEDGDGNVTVTIDNSTTITVPAQPGENVITIANVSEGEHSVDVVYDGGDNFDEKSFVKVINVTSSINAKGLVRAYNSPYDYQAEFLDREGHVLANTYVTIIVNGKKYSVKTDDQGIAKLTQTTLNVGKYDITLVNPVTGESVSESLTIVKRIVENADLTMDFDSKKYYVVRAIDDDGNPVGEGEVVGFLINGIRYVGLTNENGYAKLQINLNPKTYTITTQYRAFKVSNKVKVKQILKLVKKTVKVKKGKKLVLKAKFQWSNGKGVKGKKIVFKFKGKKYSAKTNKKGIAKVTIKKKVTKKLKKGKTYKFIAKCKKNTVKGKVKVKK